MNKEQRAELKRQVEISIELNQIPADEVVLLLEITVDDLIKRFPNKLVEHAEKFGCYPEEGEQETLVEEEGTE